MSNSYTIWSKCSNCLNVCESTLIKGTLVSDTSCPVCECFKVSAVPKPTPKKKKKGENEDDYNLEDEEELNA